MFEDGFELVSGPFKAGFGGSQRDIKCEGDLFEGEIVHIEEVDELSELGVQVPDRGPDLVCLVLVGLIGLGLQGRRVLELGIEGSLFGLGFDPIGGFVVDDAHGPWAEPCWVFEGSEPAGDPDP